MGRPRKPIDHGTPKGYLQELRRGYRTCASCRRVWRAYCAPYNAAYRARHAPGDLRGFEGNERTREKKEARLKGVTPPATVAEVMEEIRRANS